MAEQYANDAVTYLSAPLSAIATSLTVVSATGFPSSGNFRIRIDNEIILVTALSGTTWTVTRAVEAVAGIQAAGSHLTGAQVTAVLTAASVTLASVYTNPQGQTNSEAFGASATVAAADQVVFGEGANCDATSHDSTAIGQGAFCHSATFAVALGTGANCTANSAIAIGSSASASAASAIAIGDSTATSIGDGVNIGNSNTLTNGILVFGAGNTVNAAAAMGLGNFNTSSHKGAITIGQSLSSSRQRELVIGCDTSSGAGAWTGGHRIRVQSTASDNNIYDLAILDALWADSTAATRKGRLAGRVTDFNNNWLEGWRIESSGSAILIGFFGAAAVAQPATTAGHGATAGAAYTANEQKMLQDVFNALESLGLMA